LNDTTAVSMIGSVKLEWLCRYNLPLVRREDPMQLYYC